MPLLCMLCWQNLGLMVKAKRSISLLPGIMEPKLISLGQAVKLSRPLCSPSSCLNTCWVSWRKTHSSTKSQDVKSSMPAVHGAFCTLSTLPLSYYFRKVCKLTGAFLVFRWVTSHSAPNLHALLFSRLDIEMGNYTFAIAGAAYLQERIPSLCFTPRTQLVKLLIWSLSVDCFFPLKDYNLWQEPHL